MTRVGRSSITVEVEVTAEALLTGKRLVAMRGSFEMVAVDARGKPIPIPPTEALLGAEDVRREAAYGSHP